jgi:ABC-type polysaccharide/polyol phosphate export permease
MVVDPMVNVACSVQMPVVAPATYQVQQAGWSGQPYVETNPFLQVITSYTTPVSGDWVVLTVFIGDSRFVSFYTLHSNKVC